ncbi:MAG: AlpA family transcriptional regulator [Burkholderiales bacterium]|nr:AlpA family transcriptional regulator [Burkholderiales bacterium]
MALRMLRRPEVERLTGLSRSTIYQFISEGRFPAPVRLSARAVAWVDAEVDDWLRAQLDKRGSAQGRRP